MRDSADGATRSFAFGPFVLVPERQVLLRDGSAVRLGGRALDLLCALVERPGEIVSKNELLARVWPDTTVEESNLKVNMGSLRQALGEGRGTAKYIATVVGRGYRFVAQVQAASMLPPPLDARAAPSAFHNLPTGTTRIFGRADVIATIGRDLEESRLVSIVGAGGIGKTTVAIAVAESAVGAFEHGVWLADLALLKDPELVPNAIATALGVTAGPPNTLTKLGERLRDRRLLLVLDSCEHLIESAAACADRILAYAPGVKILATSREPLMVRGERIRRLPGLETPPPGRASSAEDALTFPAIQLFVERATDRLESFVLSDADAPLVAEICRSLDGLALAIELAATRIDAFGVATLRRQLEDRFGLLAGRRAGPERHRTLTATLDWSYGLLAEREAALLRAMSVFAGVFDVESASVVAQLPFDEAADVLAQLAAKSLLTPDLDAHHVAYRALETTRTYCLERLGAAGEEPAVRLRHAEHVCTVLERSASDWSQRPAREWGAAYGRVLDDLRGALAWTATLPTHRALRIRLTVVGLVLWNHLSLTEECRVHVSRALEELAREGLPGTTAEMQLEAWFGGVTMFTHGLTTEAISALRRALSIAEQRGDIDGRVRCLRLIGVYQLFTGDNDAAVRTLETLASLAASEFPSAVLDAETALGIGELFVGRLDSVRRRFERRHELDVLELTDASRMRYHVRYLSDRIVDVGNVLSHVQWLTGSPDTALRTAAATVEHAVETKHHLSLATALSWVCPVFFLSGSYEACAHHVALLGEEANRHGFAVRRPVATFYRAALACVTTHDDSALADLGRAIDEFHSTGHLARLPFYLGVHAELLAKSGRLEAAEERIRAALDRAAEKNERWCLPELLRIAAFVAAKSGRAKDSEALLVQSMAMAREIGALSWRLRSANDLARQWHHASRTEDARRTLHSVYHEFTEGFATRDLRVAAELLVTLGG